MLFLRRMVNVAPVFFASHDYIKASEAYLFFRLGSEKGGLG
jgi:hypothetical protein